MLEAMVSFSKKDRPSRLRAFRWYLLAILSGTFLLFSVSLISLARQQDAVRELSISNLRFGGERIAFELENRIRRLAADCLHREELETLHYTPGAELSLEKTRELRHEFENLKREHPIARHFFLLSDGQLIYPRLPFPPSQILSAILPAERDATAKQFAALLTRAEKEETRPHLSENAIRLYGYAENLAVPKRLKAFAAYRAARASLNAKGPAASVQSFRKLLELYGDQYDESQTPYTLSLAIGPEPLTTLLFESYPLTAVYQDLIEGRWDLSAEQAEYYLTRLEARLAMQPGSRPSSEFLDQFELARALLAEIRNIQASPSNEIVARAIGQKNSGYQVYYAPLPADNTHRTIVGFSVSIPWVQNTLLPDCIETATGSSKNVAALIEEMPLAQNKDKSAGDIYAPFKSILPFWRLHFPAYMVQVNEAAAHRELWFLGLSSGMFVSILSLGTYLLIRVSRDIQWFQLQSDFVSGVSHELKTPLSLIRLYSETLADDEQGYPPEERQGYIRIIARESERLSRLIDNVLDFSKIQKGRKQYMTQVGDLAKAVSQTVEDYSEYLALRGFSVKTGIQPNLPSVRFNAEQVSQVVLNLMDNARKYSGESRVIRIHMWKQGEEVVVEVQDHGLGIPAGEREKIFEPFYRIPGQSDKGGCGLGLYLVRHVMEGHRGRIELESEVGKGSRFRLFFPAVPARQGYPEPSEPDQVVNIIHPDNSRAHSA